MVLGNCCTIAEKLLSESLLSIFTSIYHMKYFSSGHVKYINDCRSYKYALYVHRGDNVI